MWLRCIRFFLVSLFVLSPISIPSAFAQSALSPGYAATDKDFTTSERAGREIWFYATAFNHRFFSYGYQQRLGALIDWYGVLNANDRDQRFEVWGIINDPDCCTPGSPNCPAKSLDETYGMEWCPGDETLLKFVGKRGYEKKDPACDFVDAPFNKGTPHGENDQRQSNCDLYFGTSTGALGLRKFPNPKFDETKWVALNKSPSSWENYRSFLSKDGDNPDSRANRLSDGSVEPPFLFGMACGACHISFDPLNPPEDTANPKWENVKGLLGNQYSRVSELLASGLSKHSLEWQMIGRARPGVVDTSALPMDFVSNPGTMNAIINLVKRPVHEHDVTRWEKTATCSVDSTERSCWCEPGKDGKCWEKRRSDLQVPNVLKGGEDSVGLLEAIQRVYFNIGSCAEQCWMNHIPDIRAVDPTQRNYGQTPFDIGQCRRDCASFRAIEDRLDDLAAFFMTGRPTDLWDARKLAGPRALAVQLDQEFGEGAVDRGRDVFAGQCARCHSSQEGPYTSVDFLAKDPKDQSLRVDWLGNDKVEFASEIGTYRNRALHSNHLETRVWAEYASHDVKARQEDVNLPEIHKGGGRGYYRNISLLSVWAHAPFMQNNAIGPEICGQPNTPQNQLYHSPYVDENGDPLPENIAPKCWAYDPSVKGRYKLFTASMDALLNPDKRVAKIFMLDREMIFDVAPKVKLGSIETGLSLRAPKGAPTTYVNNLRIGDLVQDLALLHTDEENLRIKYEKKIPTDRYDELKAGLKDLIRRLIKNPGYYVVNITEVQGDILRKYYSNSLALVENEGHRFGEGLTDQQKKDLTAFMATL